MKVIGLILSLLEPTRLYCLRYNTSNEFNKSGKLYSINNLVNSQQYYTNSLNIAYVSNTLQNMILQYASINTFIKYYLPRRSGNVRTIMSSNNPQDTIMKATSRMTR